MYSQAVLLSLSLSLSLAVVFLCLSLSLFSLTEFRSLGLLCFGRVPWFRVLVGSSGFGFCSGFLVSGFLSRSGWPFGLPLAQTRVATWMHWDGLSIFANCAGFPRFCSLVCA